MKKLIAKLKALIAKLQGKNVAPAPVAPAPTLPIYHIPGPALPAAPTPAPPANSIPPLVVPTGFPPDHPDAWPRIVEFKGVKIKLNAPVNELWEPSLAAYTFGKYGSFVADPSNAPPGYPNRTPAGFPIHYGGVHFDVSKGAWAGEPMPEWGIPMHDVVLFPNGRSDVDTVDDHLARRKVRDDNSAENDRITASTRYLGPINAASLSQNDRAWLYVKSTQFREVQYGNGLKNGDLHRTVLNGMAVDINRVINDGEGEQRSAQNAGEPDNKELQRVVEEAIALAAAGNPPMPKSVS